MGVLPAASTGRVVNRAGELAEELGRIQGRLGAWLAELESDAAVNRRMATPAQTVSVDDRVEHLRAANRADQTAQRIRNVLGMKP